MRKLQPPVISSDSRIGTFLGGRACASSVMHSRTNIYGEGLNRVHESGTTKLGYIATFNDLGTNRSGKNNMVTLPYMSHALVY